MYSLAVQLRSREYIRYMLVVSCSIQRCGASSEYSLAVHFRVVDIETARNCLHYDHFFLSAGVREYLHSLCQLQHIIRFILMYHKYEIISGQAPCTLIIVNI